MKQEISAGGIIVHRSQTGWEVLLMRDMNNSYTFPKGIIEKGEDPKNAAVREISEEVGIRNPVLLRSLGTVEYFYRKNGTIQKNVHYFLFLLRRMQVITPQHEEGISEARWVPLQNALELIGYKVTNGPLLSRTIRWLHKHGGTIA